MKLTLLNMPWATHSRPSAALGALTAYVQREAPSVSVRAVSEHFTVATALGYELYAFIAENSYVLGELLYLAQLYPERNPQIKKTFVETLAKATTHPPSFFGDFGSFEEIYLHMQTVISEHLASLVERLRPEVEVLGLTTSFGQLFANLALCQRLKQAAPNVVSILGGSTVSSRVGLSLLKEYDCADYIIQGEGERPLVALLNGLQQDPSRIVTSRGLLARQAGRAPIACPPLWEVEDLNTLPAPDYDEYASLAVEHGIDWSLPMEGSRGCWWDRTKRSHNPRSTCYFCNLNVQWNGYRQKSVARITQELDALSTRYSNTRVYFLDNIIRHNGIQDLAAAISGLHRDFSLFYEMRANVRPVELLAMWEAGLTEVQFGIEALSSSLLARIGKGTRTIQNLEAMKTCCELGIQNLANLITDFPGSTQDEVEETCRNIERYALSFSPCFLTRFHLGVDSSVDVLRQEFGITNVRNAEVLRAGLPEDLWTRLSLFDLDFDLAEGSADWSPVSQACERWRARHAEVGGPLLVYYDGGTFLRIIDQRYDHEIFLLYGALRALYLECMSIVSLEQLTESLAGIVARDALLGALGELIDKGLIFEEGGKYLSLAVASSPRIAAQRIRQQALLQQNKRYARRASA